MQAHNKASKGLDAKTKKDLGIIETLLQIVRTKGVRSLYRGFVANIINTFIQRTCLPPDGRICVLLVVHSGA